MNASLYNGSSGIPADSRGLHYGDGVFRTIRAHRGDLLDWDLHLAKLAMDCARLDLRMPSASLLHAEALSLVAGDSCVIKLILARRSEGRGYAPQSTECDRLLIRSGLPAYPDTCWSEGIAAIHCELRLSTQPALAGIKHLNRLEQVLASRDWPEGVREGILCDADGNLVCGTRSNLFWRSSGVWHTPRLDRCGVAGMMRGKLIELMENSGMKAVEVRAPQSAIENADEAFLSNALIGIWPIKSLGARQWTAGVETRRLMQLLNHPGPQA